MTNTLENVTFMCTAERKVYFGYNETIIDIEIRSTLMKKYIIIKGL